MKIKLISAVAGLALACLAAVAPAQGMRYAPEFALFMNDRVLKELKLTGEQESSIKATLKEFVRPHGLVIPAGTDVQDINKSCMKVLDEGQKVRARELWIQFNGEVALAHSSVAKELNLSDAQKKDIESILDDMNEKIQEAVRSQQPDDEGRVRFNPSSIRNRAKEKLAKVLTAEQTEKFKKMQGEKFEFTLKKKD